MERVTGKKPCLEESENISSEVLKSKVFFATISNPAGKNLEKIEKIAKENNLELERIRGKRECYVFAVSCDSIIIIGSDKRGTIYGLFHLSELMGGSTLGD